MESPGCVTTIPLPTADHVDPFQRAIPGVTTPPPVVANCPPTMRPPLKLVRAKTVEIPSTPVPSFDHAEPFHFAMRLNPLFVNSPPAMSSPLKVVRARTV